MFRELLSGHDAHRAVGALRALLAHRFAPALTGGLAIAAHRRAHGQTVPQRGLNDVDLVVEDITSVPQSLAAEFIFNHVHPDASDGKTLVQVIDRTNRVRIDLFRAFGDTLARAVPSRSELRGLSMVSVEDLVARQTALVCGALERGREIDAKHVETFLAMTGFGEPHRLGAAWADHRQQVAGTLSEAASRAVSLLQRRPELVVSHSYELRLESCARCRPYGDLVPASPNAIAEILGYS